MQRFVRLVLLATFSTAHAEPTSAVRYLMNTPVSSFQWGLYLMETKLARPDFDLMLQNAPAKISVMPTALYDWDANRINLEITALTATAIDSEGGKAICKAVMKFARGVLGIDNETGKPETLNASDLFFPTSYTNKDKPKEIHQELLAIVELSPKVYAPIAGGGTYKLLTECQGSLASTDVFFKEPTKE